MSTPGQGQPAASTTEVLAATIAAVVERQLTQYVSTVVKQVEAAKAAAEEGKAELRAEFRAQMDELMAQHTASLQQLQGALESRLTDFSHHQQFRLNEVENRLLEMPGSAGADSAEVAALKDQLDSQSAAAHARIDDLQRATRRFDEQAAALVQHVNDTTVALAQRMDEGNSQLAAAVEERLGFVRTTLERVGPEVQRQLTDQATNLAQRLDFVEHKITDRMLTMEDRVNEQNGVKIAAVEAAVGRISSGFDDAIGAMSHRLLGIENRQEELVLHLEALRQQVSKVDEDAIQEVKDQVSAAVGEAMLVRIEMDRVKDTLEEKFDKSAVEHPISFYFTLGSDDKAKWTVKVDRDTCQIRQGKPDGGTADCVLKTSPDMFRKIVLDAYTPSPAEFMAGAIKSNDIGLLMTFQKVFQLASL